jgi:hypothetical protein
MVALLMAWPVAAQELRGSIEGVVKDASGAVLPGVTITAQTANGAVVTTVTDDTGTYRFPSLAPGDYTITANLQGFAPGKNDAVRVSLGQVKKVDFSLAVQGLTESVQVTAESPLVDVRSTTRQTNIRAEQVELLPKGRDFTSLVTQASGANSEPKSGGISIDGASAGENRYIIDGIETTDIQDGTSGKNVIADFIEEVQVKSSGYTAEFGGATGGVINVLTKSGTNNWRGNVGLQMQGDALTGNRRPTLRLNPTNTTIAEYHTFPEDDQTRLEPGFALGGPILRNRAWFFGAYQPALTTSDRAVDPATAGNPSAGTQTSEQKTQVQYATGNVSAQLSDALRGRVAFNNNWSEVKGLLPALGGTDPQGTNYAKTSTFPNYSISGNIDWVASPNLFFGIRGGYFSRDQYDSNVTEEPRVIFSNGNNLNIPGVPDNLRQAQGFNSIPTNNKVDRDQFTRAYFQADGTMYGNLAGAHQLKFGVQLDRVGNNVLSGESANLVRIHWGFALSSGVPLTNGPYGYYQVRSNGVDPKKGFVTEGDIHTTNIGLFLQDSWTINNNLTVNLGIRTERERVPTYAVGSDIPEFGLEFPFSDKIAPRVGFSYDVNGDGRWKAFGSWGVFYDIFKLELPRGSFGGDKWLEYYYTLDTFDWTTLVSGANCPPACSGTLIRGPIDFRHPSFGSDSIDPDLKPMKQQEGTAGIEHQFSDKIAFGLRYVHKQLDRTIEDAGALDADGNEIYVVANPGFGLTAFAHPGVPYPKAVRDYDSVEFSLEKRFADSWYLRSSYLWSRLYGNYSGLSQSDENGRTSPNIGRVFDYPMMMFQDGGEPALGRLATDRPHQFKTQFIYQFGFGTSVGVNQYVFSGLPVSREIGIYPTSNLPVQYLGRGSDGRTPMLSQTDLQLQHGFRIGARQLQLTFNVLNLFNQDTAISKFTNYHRLNGVSGSSAFGANALDEDLFYSGQQTLAQLIEAQGVIKHPAFLMDNGFQAPIQARIGVKFIF